MTSSVRLVEKAGHNVNGEMAEPEGAAKVGTIVLVHEWWGVNDHIRDLAKRASEAGFLVLAPDLYHGESTTDPAEAKQLADDLDTAHAVVDIGSAVSFARAHERSNGKVGVMGFCLGGALSLAAACAVEDLAGAVAFYGIPPEAKVDYTRLAAPVQMHVGAKDRWVTPEKAEALQKRLQSEGKHVDLFIYDADHAFVNDTRPEVYAPAAAREAWQRAMTFFGQHLA